MWRIFFNLSHPNFLRRSLLMDSEMNNRFWLPGLPAHTSSSTVLGEQACSFGFHFYVGVEEVLKLGRKHFQRVKYFARPHAVLNCFYLNSRKFNQFFLSIFQLNQNDTIDNGFTISFYLSLFVSYSYFKCFLINIYYRNIYFKISG